jgi:hypothetical protein
VNLLLSINPIWVDRVLSIHKAKKDLVENVEHSPYYNAHSIDPNHIGVDIRGDGSGSWRR